jgi:hypothetical protein
MKRDRLPWALGWVSFGIGIGLAAARVPWSSLFRRGMAVKPATGIGMDLGGPAESWRGSGLAEDVGNEHPRGDEGPPEEVKQRIFREAERELGLPELDERR